MESNLKQLHRDIERAVKRLGISEDEKRLAELQTLSRQPDFWKQPERAAEAGRELAKIEQKITPWRSLEKRVKDLLDMASLEEKTLENDLKSEFEGLKKEFEGLKTQLKFSGPYDERDAFLSVHSGTGGTDAMDWAQMLERMYLRYGERAGLKTELIEEQAGEEAGIKHATLRFSGPFSYGRLKSEHGVHRLVRLSPFNADNLRQTSFALVEVLPEIEKSDEIELDEKDLKVDVFRAGGHGGQSVNTTDSAVRITHLPTKITVVIQNERSQLQNRQTAMKILNSKLIQLQLEQHKEKISELKGPDTQAAWGNQTRNYVLHPYTLVKDTRTGLETKNAQAVLDGQLDEFIDAYLEHELGGSDKARPHL